MERLVIFFPLSLRGFLKGSRGNLSLSVIASPPKAGVAISMRLASPTHSPTLWVGERDCFVATLLAMTVGGVIASLSQERRGNLKLDCFVATLLAMTVGGCHCEASRKRSRGNLLFNGIYYNPAPKEIATPERLSVQAHNDKSVDCFVASAPRNDRTAPLAYPKIPSSALQENCFSFTLPFPIGNDESHDFHLFNNLQIPSGVSYYVKGGI